MRFLLVLQLLFITATAGTIIGPTDAVTDNGVWPTEGAVFIPTNAATITCPTDPVTDNGEWPTETSMKFIPADFNCTINFVIPDGFILKLNTAYSVSGPFGNQLEYEDSVGVVRKLYGTQNVTFHLPANTANVRIQTMTNEVTLFMQYEYRNIKTIKNYQRQVGTYAIVQNSTSYTFLGQKGVVLGSNSNNYDLPLIFVYAGSNLNGKYLGTPNSFISKNYNALTIVQFDDKYFGQLVVSAEYDDAQHGNYYVRDDCSFSGNPAELTFTNANTIYVLVCDDNQVFIQNIKFDSTWGADQSFELFPSSNSEEVKPLVFDSKTDYSDILPLKIPYSMLRLVVKKASFTLILNNTDDSWLTPKVGRSIYVYSDSYWQKGNEVVRFPYNFGLVFVKLMSKHVFIASHSDFYQFDVTFNLYAVDQIYGNYMNLVIGAGNSTSLNYTVSCDDSCAKTVTVSVVGTGQFARLDKSSYSQSVISMTTIKVLQSDVTLPVSTTTATSLMTTPTNSPTSTRKMEPSTSATTKAIKISTTTRKSGVPSNYCLALVLLSILLH